MGIWHTGKPRSGPGARAMRPRGLALMVTLAVVLLLTTFLSRFFFASGLEMRSISNFRNTMQARSMARSVLKVLQVGLQQDEADFFAGYREVEKMLSVLSQPLLDGLLLEVKVEPLDHRYNLNELYNLRPGEDVDRGRWNLFYNVLVRLEVPPTEEELQLDPEAQGKALTDEQISTLYAALFDWIDQNDEDYNLFPGVYGAEAGSYLSEQPEFEVKNGMLDQLSEIRLVRDLTTNGVPWEDLSKQFAALPKATDGNFYFQEKINVNTATREEIIAFLENRRMDPAQIEGSIHRPNQEGINLIVDKAEELADEFTATNDEGGRERFTQASLKSVLQKSGVNQNLGANFLFSIINKYYLVRIVTEVNGIQARLEAKLHVPRNANTRMGTQAEVLWMRVY